MHTYISWNVGLILDIYLACNASSSSGLARLEDMLMDLVEEGTDSINTPLPTLEAPICITYSFEDFISRLILPIYYYIYIHIYCIVSMHITKLIQTGLVNPIPHA